MYWMLKTLAVLMGCRVTLVEARAETTADRLQSLLMGATEVQLCDNGLEH